MTPSLHSKAQAPMSNTIGQLDPSFTQLIASTMEMERQPLTRLKTQRDRAAAVWKQRPENRNANRDGNRRPRRRP